MDRQQDRTIEALLEHLIERGPNDVATVFGRAFELAMRDASASGTLAPPLRADGYPPRLRERLQAQAHRHAGGHGRRRCSQDCRP